MKSETGHNIVQKAKEQKQKQLEHLQEIREKYNHPIERARVLRTTGVGQFHNKTGEWRTWLVASIRELEVARPKDLDIEERDLIRAESLGKEVLGRTSYIDNLRRGSNGCYPSALGILERALSQLKDWDKKDNGRKYLRPNQREIGLILAIAMGERYSFLHNRGFRALARAALIAPFNETRFVRDRTEGLAREERTEKWKRGFSHLAFATRLTFASDSYVKREDVRHKTADILLEGLPSYEDDEAKVNN